MTERNNNNRIVVERARRIWLDPMVGYTVYDVIHSKGSPFEALMYAPLFWPDFVVVGDMTFLPFAVEDDSDRGQVRHRLAEVGDPARVEEEFNAVEVASLFGSRRSETVPAEDAVLAGCLAEMWTAKLKIDFPLKNFCVRVSNPTRDAEIEITLYEQRSE